MTLIKSISGIRGTIGGPCGEALTPVDIVKFTYAYCERLRRHAARNAAASRSSWAGTRASAARWWSSWSAALWYPAASTWSDAGLRRPPPPNLRCASPEPTAESSSRPATTPREWNALKLLNSEGEFLSAAEGNEILEIADSGDFDFASVDELGHIEDHDFTDEHVDSVLALESVDADAVRRAGFTVVVDAINSVGALIMPRLLEKLGVRCILLNGTPDGDFAHNPEPLPQNLTGLSEAVRREHADLGISVDPDVDRLAFFCENGEPFVEEYTLVAVADYLLERASAAGVKPLHTVSNLSSSRALRDVTERWGRQLVRRGGGRGQRDHEDARDRGR